jgi:hypothetical protein
MRPAVAQVAGLMAVLAGRLPVNDRYVAAMLPVRAKASNAGVEKKEDLSLPDWAANAAAKLIESVFVFQHRIALTVEALKGV